MTLKINVPEPVLLKPKISIFGVGGAGGNALNNMIRSNLEGVEFIAANTDAQSLANSLAANRIQLGVEITKGLGAGSFPDRGRAAAEENIEEIIRFLDGNNMVFITAGMGGGTGTGAAPVIAKLARERDILTVGVVTKPFQFEGKYRMEAAEQGIEDLKKCVDTLIIIPNQNLFRIANEQTTFESAFKMADNVLHAGVRGVTDLITMPGLVNLDFADIRTIMTKSGKALMGTGEASGENRAVIACEEAISNPLLDDISIRGAKGVLVNMTGGPDMTLFEADLAVNTIKKEVDDNANIIFGSAFNEDMEGKIRISVVATGIDDEEFQSLEYARDFVRPTYRTSTSPVSNEELRNSENSGIAKDGQETYFDPGQIKEPLEDIIKTSEENFYSKIEITTSTNSQEIEEVQKNDPETLTEQSSQETEQENKIQNDNLFAPQKENKEIPTITENIKIPTREEIEEERGEIQIPIKKKVKKEFAKKEGFSLFGFMNKGSKNSEESTKKPKEFKSNKATIMDDDDERIVVSLDLDHKNDHLDDQDDMLNVPAFFRRKK
ncbi:MAG: cell division protein FtsZ [Myxococcota bacterium]|jgi:cell division protein FtsZ